MDAFFDSAETSAPSIHSSPPSSIHLDDMPPHVTSFPSPPQFAAQDFEVKPVIGFYAASESYESSGTFTPPEDFHFAPSSAPEMSHMDLVHQALASPEIKLESASGYWSPTPADMAAHTRPAVPATAPTGSFLSDLYASGSIDLSDHGVSPEALTNSGPSSPSWSITDGQQEQAQQQLGTLRRIPCESWSHQHRDDILPPVSTLLFDHHRQSSQPYDRFDESHSFELRPVVYGGEPLGYEPASFQTRGFDEGYMRGAHVQDFAPLEYEHKGNGSGVIGGTNMVYNVPVMHTDDAASKETQYLRRRCFNCRATEPPSWRRSTLNPGKIVCNKCGLYERTHLRPRPHRFDELRGSGAGVAKPRKSNKSSITGAASQGKGTLHPRSADHRAIPHRRTSMASLASAASSDNWDDYSATSTSSASPPLGSAIEMELPQIVQLPQPPALSRPHSIGRKLSTASVVEHRGPWSPTASSFATPQGLTSPRRTLPIPHDYFSRRGSFDVGSGGPQRRQQHIPIETGWQTIPLDATRPRNTRAKLNSLPSRSIAAA